MDDYATVVERIGDAVAKFQEYNVVKPTRLELTSKDADLLQQWADSNLIHSNDQFECREELIGCRIHGLCVVDINAQKSKVLGPNTHFTWPAGVEPAYRPYDKWDDMLDSLHYTVSRMSKPNYLFDFVDDLTKDVDLSDSPPASDTRPKHYGGDSNPFEAIKIIEHYDLNFSLGNVVKYVLRCGKKDDEIEELRKARQYIDFEIKRRERDASS